VSPAAAAPAIELELADESATRRLAAAIALRSRPGDVIALMGDLGSGKTVFARGFLEALGHKGEVPSPTFTLVQSYDTVRGPVAHFDLYRLARAEDALELGLEDAAADGMLLVEWPERLGAQLPRPCLLVRLAAGAGATVRRARLSGDGDWPDRLREIAAA
jgi:tRNA threonylcarbamoyladenosine biosynthesis protein TsaE